MSDTAIPFSGVFAFKRYFWALIAILQLVAAALIYCLLRPATGVARGNTVAGMLLGVWGLLLIVFLILLAVRRRRYDFDRFSLRGWTSAHIYLGLIVVPIETLHAGFRFGWDIHTLCYALSIVVVASGLAGTILYIVLPTRLLQHSVRRTIPDIASEIEQTDAECNNEAARLLDKAGDVEEVRKTLTARWRNRGVWAVLRRPRSGNLTGRAITTVRNAVEQLELTDVVPARMLLARLYRRAELIDLLRREQRLRLFLRGWLYIHVPATAALAVALTAHILVVLFV
jgi:hypothetical protein